MTATTLVPHTFTAADRCDRCGAQASTRAVLTTGDLLFCAHHTREYGEQLATRAVTVEHADAPASPAPA